MARAIFVSGLVQTQWVLFKTARRKRRTFPDEKEDLCHLAGVGDAARRIARDGICGGGQRRQAGRDETAWQCENFDAMAELFTAPYRLADGTRNGVN